MKKAVIVALGVAICLYAVLTLVYSLRVAEIGVQCAFDTDVLQVVPDFFGSENGSQYPQVGDRIVQINGQPIRSWSEFVHLVGRLDPAKTPSVVIEIDRGGRPLRFVSAVRWPSAQVFFQPVLWFLLKLGVIIVAGVVFWNRPDNPATTRFFLLCTVTIGAFMGGYHWLRITGSPPLVIVFMTCATLLPAVVLHFYLLFPKPKEFLVRRPRTTLVWLYLPLGLLLAVMLTTYLSVVWTFRRGYEPDLVFRLTRVLLHEIYVTLGVAAVYFLGCVASLAHSFMDSRPGSAQRKQAKWILAGALVATIPIAYSLYLAVTDIERFALGGAAWPMFAASICLTAAYGISMSRYGLLEVNQFLNWGLVSIGVSAAAGLVYCGLVFLGALMIGSQLEPHLSVRAAVWVSLTAWVLLIALDLFRWRWRRAMDRQINQDKVQVEKTLRQLGQVVEDLEDPSALSHRLLHTLADLMHFDRGMIYLRPLNEPVFRLASHLGAKPPLEVLPPGSPLPDALRHASFIDARSEAGYRHRLAQRQLSFLGGEVALPLRHERELMAIVIAGPKRSGKYTIDEIRHLTTVTQIAAPALHGAAAQHLLEQLNRELQEKVEKISEQQRRIVALQTQLGDRNILAPKGPNDGAVSIPEADAPAVTTRVPDHGIIGSSEPIRRLLAVIGKVAASPSAVLIRGESGTGKELLAQALHRHSPRADGPFVKVHCAALSPGLLESELFGHVKGAFTGAHRDKVGRFEMADGGTLFLDEIGDISLEVQTKLLRVLQEMMFERVGSSKPVKVDVRLITATHQNLEELMRQGRFREDLFYRLNVITLHTPPLRDRREDIPELALHFLQTFARRTGRPSLVFDDEVLETLKAYDWPGNVRELENVIERAVVLADRDIVTVRELPPELVRDAQRSSEQRDASDPTFRPSRRGNDLGLAHRDWKKLQNLAERDRLVQALALAGGNKSQAARALGMPRSTLVSKLEKYGLLPGRKSR